MQNYTDVIVPKIEEAFRNLGAKFAGDPDVAIAYAGIGEMHNLLQFLYREGTQLHADHVQAIQVKQELDESLLQSVAELSVQTEKVRKLSKKEIKNVDQYLSVCTTIIVDTDTETAANIFMTNHLKANTEKLNGMISRHGLLIEREKFAIKKASVKLPKLVLELAALNKLVRMRNRKEKAEVKKLSDKADRTRKMEALKHEERRAKLQQAVDPYAHLSLVDYEAPHEAPRVAEFVDDEAVEAKSNDYYSDSDSES